MTKAEAEKLKAAGNQALMANNLSEAIELYTKAINADGTNHVYYSNRSAAYLKQGNATMALEDANSCIGLNSEFSKGYSRKGAALHSMKRFNDAIAAYEDGLSKFAGDAALTKGLNEAKRDKERAEAGPSMGGAGAGFNNLFGPNLLAKVAAHPKLASYMSDASFVEKINKLSTGNMSEDLIGDPRIMEVLQVMLGLPEKDEGGASSSTPAPAPAAVPKQETEESKKAEPEPMEVEEETEPAVLAKLKGNKLYSQKKFDEALQAYDEAISLDGTSMTFYINKAAVYLTTKQYEKAVEMCKEGLEVGKANLAPFEERAKAYARMGKAYQVQKKYEEAIECYKNAQLESFDKGVQRTLKNLELEKKKADTLAYQDDEKAEEAKARGNDFFREKKFGEAVKEYEEAVKRAPKNAIIRNNLAAALCKIMDFNGAKREIELALDLDPEYVKAYARKGDIEIMMKEYHKAMDSFKKGLALDSTNSACKEGLKKVSSMINANMTDEERKERAAHAMADPEIQGILQDPVIRQILQDFNDNPNAAQAAMRDAGVRAKIEKLIASGILQTG
mmetsp:Transcript_195/g.338  ORF Transcript_195/g.338 Transcript_195/m.338 type:complete len:562 (+) Transcript_195:77-1762(+)